ncbi:MAG: hypothetical protein K0R63_54 [Rickettsiales bacterium]|jgi:hypothetical protein|nr:hypothetical protein [Rickettsiales bacterium]
MRFLLCAFITVLLIIGVKPACAEVVSSKDTTSTGYYAAETDDADMEILRIAADQAASRATKRLMVNASGMTSTIPTSSTQNSYILSIVHF